MRSEPPGGTLPAHEEPADGGGDAPASEAHRDGTPTTISLQLVTAWSYEGHKAQ